LAFKERYIDIEADSSDRGLRRGSATARLLGLRVRIPPKAWMSVAECRVVQVEVSASGRSLIQSSLTECGVIECGQMQ